MTIPGDAGAAPATAAALWRRRAGDDHVGLRFEDDSWTWSQVLDEVAVRAAWLARRRPDGPFHVGVLLENIPEFLFILGGAALAGATVVGVNPTRRGEELAADIRHTDCGLVVSDSVSAPVLDGLDLGPATGRVHLVDGDDWRAELAAGPGVAPPSGDPDPAALHLLLFTSGSTGAPKAVRVSQRRLAESASAMARGGAFGPGDVLYCAMPMFHGNALNSCVMPAVASGATLVLRRRFSASGFAADLHRYGVTYFNYVGRALAYILATPAAPSDADNRLKFGFGTEAAPADMAAFKRRFGCPIVEGYGSSEGAIAMTRVPGTPRTALGKPPEGDDVAVVDPETGEERVRARFDDAGRLLNAAEAIGEIVGRDGVGRFEGYYANEPADAARTRGGWFWSGDLGYRDEDGYFYFAGRPADWLRVDGENFAAAPVERILARFPGVLTVAVYPVPDPRTGDQVMATLEMREGSGFDPEAFATFVDGQPDLGTKWAPRFVRLGRVPLTGTNKVDKQPLRAAGFRTADPLWWRPPGDAGPYRRFGPDDLGRLTAEFEAVGRAALLDL